jgi:hypothetical protein
MSNTNSHKSCSERQRRGRRRRGETEEDDVIPFGLMVLRRSGSSWLYSTLIVMHAPELFRSVQSAPMDSFAARGTHRLFMSQSFSSLTPVC